MNASYTVPPPAYGRHICFERITRVWVAFLDGRRVAAGITAEAAREGLDRYETKRNGPQITRLPCGRYQLKVCGKERGVFNTRREARAALESQ